MAQILDPIPPEQSEKILCCYVNVTSKIQVARISNIANWYFERVVFPGQRLVFEAPLEGQLEIHTGMMASAILSDTIKCDRRAIDEPNSDFETDSKTDSTSVNKKETLQTINTKPRESKQSLKSLV